MFNSQFSIRLFFLIAIGLIFGSKSFSQTYQGFPDSNAVWQINLVDWGNFIPMNPFGIDGDTLIGSSTYRKIYQSNDTSYNENNISYYAAVRDSASQWYFVPSSQSQEYLLYDFSASQGDTLGVDNYWGEGYQEMIVDSVDSVLIGTAYRKRMFLNDINGNWFPEIWIDGIGSNHGLFYPAEYHFDLGHWLICFHENDSLLYIDSPSGDCYYKTGNVDENSASRLNVYPNPATTELNFEFYNTGEVASIIISDLNGRIVLKKVGIGSNENVRINLEVFEDGVYFYGVKYMNGDFLRGKLVVTH